MPVYFYKVYGPYVGCEGYGILTADTLQDAENDAYQLAVENYETYDFGEEEDEGVEPEYDFLLEEYDPEQHDMYLSDTEIEFAQSVTGQFNPHQA